MSQTACWATNKLEECCWFSGGYGSCYDLSRYWVSLEGLKALVRMDWRDPVTEKDEFERAGANSRLRMKYSAYHIHIPGDNGEKAHQWFEEVFPLAGWYEDEYMAFRKERGMTPYFNDVGYDDFFKTTPDWEMYKNCERMADVIEYCPFNREYALGKRCRYFNGFYIVEDESYNQRSKEYFEKQEEMMSNFCSSLDEDIKKEEPKEDEAYITVKYEDGQSLVHIPKDFYSFGSMCIKTCPSSENEVCPPQEWFLFGGERDPETISDKYIFTRHADKFRRPYIEISADFYVHGGHIAEAERYYGKCSFQAREDLYENPNIP